jgi:hypothetical protein
MRKHVFVCCIVLMNLASGLYGMKSEQVSDRGARAEVKEGDAESAVIPTQKPFLVGGFLMYAGGRLVPVLRKAPRKGINPVTRERINIPPISKPPRKNTWSLPLFPRKMLSPEEQRREANRKAYEDFQY